MKVLLVAIAVVLSASPALAVYDVPNYARDTACVESISASLPQTAALGSRMDALFTVTPRKQLNEGLALYLYLLKDGKVYDAQVIRPHIDPTKCPPGRPFAIGPCSISIPADLAPGGYEFRAGVYTENVCATGSIRLTGTPTGKRQLVITTGRFVDKYGTPHYWHINKAHTLIWDGKPFIPAGGMFIYDRDWNLVKAQLDLLKRYGVRNIYLHLGVNQPYPWKDYSDEDYRFFQSTIDYLDDNGFTYGIEFQALEAKGPGYDYPGGGPSVDHVKESGVVRVEVKEPRSAVFLVSDNATGRVVQYGTARVVDNKTVEADVKLPKSGDYRVVFQVDKPGPDGFVMYYWDDKYENYVAKVREHYSKIRLGPGFRFLVDPLWNEMNTNHGFVPSAPAFAEQFSRWLKDRYGTIEKLNDAWKPIGSKWPTFSAAGSTVSIARIDDKLAAKLMQHCYSRSANRFYAIDACASQFNYDVREFIGRSLLHYCNDIADVFKQLNDVPVIYKAFSDVDWWHINDTGLASGHDGLGMESYGNGEPMLMFMGAHVFGECEQAAKTTWLIVTETGEGNHQDAVLSRNKSIGYTDRLTTMYANYNALISGGAKGIYQFNMIGGRGTQEPWTDNLSRDPRQLEWLATYDRILANAAALVDYKPAMYFRFPAQFNPCSMGLYSEPCGDFYNMGGWWWREPIERSQNGIWIVPSISLAPDAPMFIVNLEKAPASERFAAELTDAVRAGKRITMIGFRKDLGVIPAVDRYYTNDYAVNERGRRFQVLKPTATSRVLGKTARGQVWNLIDGSLQINSEEVFGQHGYQPQDLVTGSEKSLDPYDGVFDLLGVELLDLGPDLTGFKFEDNGVPTTVITARSKITLRVPKDATDCLYANGDKADAAEITLEPANRMLTNAHYDWAPDGILIDSLNTTETIIITGAYDIAADVPRTARDEVSCVWIEGEKPASHNFNYSWMGGIPTLSGNGFLALETAVTPPKDNGWYASYEFFAPKKATYQLWLRESHLSFSSPCSYRVDNGPWIKVTNMLVSHDTRVVTLYNPVEDTRQIFAWYHYAGIHLAAGRHTITFRVDEPRPKGTVLTMADDRPYAKQIDCIVLIEGGFVPDGKQRPTTLVANVEPAMVNLLPNPGVEFDPNGDDQCDGWTPASSDGVEWTKPGWGNIRVEGLFDVNCSLKESFAGLRALKISAGPVERWWSSTPVRLDGETSLLAGGFVRTSSPQVNAFLRVKWLDDSACVIKTDILPHGAADSEWHEIKTTLTRPASTHGAIFECVVSPGASGTAWFDDLVLAKPLP